jgi:hypothetical protein
LDFKTVMKKFQYDLKNYKNYIFFETMIRYCKKLDQSCNILISNLCLVWLCQRLFGNVLDVIYRSKTIKLPECIKKFQTIQLQR